MACRHPRIWADWAPKIKPVYRPVSAVERGNAWRIDLVEECGDVSGRPHIQRDGGRYGPHREEQACLEIGQVSTGALKVQAGTGGEEAKVTPGGRGDIPLSCF